MSDSWRPEQSLQERLNRTQLSMTPGTLHGRIAQAAPVPRDRKDTGDDDSTVEAIFCYTGQPVIGQESPPYINRMAAAEVGTITAATRSNASGPTTIAVLLNGSPIGQVTVPAGNHQTGETTVEDVLIDYGDHLSVVAIEAGAVGVTVQVSIEA